MKQLKNILLTGFLALLAFAACTEDKLIDEQPMETGTVSISFSTEGVETKAIDAGGNYEYATAEELNINEIFVSIFKKEGNEWKYLTSKSGTLDDGSFVGEQSSGSFKLTGLTLPLNTDLKVVAIANPLAGKAASYAKMDYNTLSAEKVAYSATLGEGGYYTFDPRTLIKVGEQDMRFTANNGAISGGEDVRLKQLAAKVGLDLKVDLPKMEGSTTTSEWMLDGFTLKELMSVLNKELMNNASNMNNAVFVYKLEGKLFATQTKDDIPKNATVIATAMNGNGCKHVDCKVGDQLNSKCAHLTITDKKSMTIQKIETTPGWLFKLNTVQVVNVNTESELILSEEIKNDLLNKVNTQILSVNKACSTIDLAFYTYERDKAANLSDALTVRLVGEFAEGKTIKTSTYGLSGSYLHPCWDAGEGWGDGNSQFSLYDDDLSPSGDPISSSEITSTADGTDYQYSIPINPEYEQGECTDGLIHGNYYKVTGTLKRSTGEFKLWVTKWGAKLVNVNFN